jgi:alkylhydroperoxidase family enzyme
VKLGIHQVKQGGGIDHIASHGLNIARPGELALSLGRSENPLFYLAGVTFGPRPVSPCQQQVTAGGIMPSHTRIPKAELTGIYGALVKRMSRKMLGDVPEPVEVAWHNRKVLNFSFSVGRKVQKWDRCDENLKSYAHMAVASLVGCSFCLDLGYFNAQNQGLDVTKMRAVARWRESDVFTPLERDVLAYAEAMTSTPPTVTDELSARLLAALGASAMVELTTFIALANFMTRSNTAFGIESQEFAAACELRPVS